MRLCADMGTSAYHARLDRVEGRVAGTCQSGCAKCAILKIAAAAAGDAWTGCDGRPAGLVELLQSLPADSTAPRGEPLCE